jgi:hypothetical protein
MTIDLDHQRAAQGDVGGSRPQFGSLLEGGHRESTRRRPEARRAEAARPFAARRAGAAWPSAHRARRVAVAAGGPGPPRGARQARAGPRRLPRDPRPPRRLPRALPVAHEARLRAVHPGLGPGRHAALRNRARLARRGGAPRRHRAPRRARAGAGRAPRRGGPAPRRPGRRRRPRRSGRRRRDRRLVRRARAASGAASGLGARCLLRRLPEPSLRSPS